MTTTVEFLSDRRMTMENMKPCPFCGGEDIEVVTDMFGDDNYIVTCKSCAAQVSDETMKQAIESWNNRK